MEIGIYLVVLVLLVVLGFLCGCQSRYLYKDSRVMMGTFVEVTSPDKQAAGIAFAEIKRIEDLLSKYKPESEVSQLNKTGKIKASPETIYVLKKAKEFWLASEGAFDITVGPLVQLWGFKDKNYYVPKDEEIKKILNLVGFEKILFKDNDNVVEFSFPEMSIDLGAIAKGYAVDCAIDKIRAAGITSCLINAGGDIYALGNRFGRPWRIAIQDPRGKKFFAYLELENQAIATSGDYEQYFLKRQKRYAHIFDPQTGYPANSGLVSVTVVAGDCLTADALATSLFVLGKDKGQKLAEKFPQTKIKLIEIKDIVKYGE
ncbi:MAG: FAD:protein FMN transferase [Candidatus Omnitrophica bacterium]|nr:FAD:protein FMN transferase [Candidatus Omnitrophota bacterium]